MAHSAENDAHERTGWQLYGELVDRWNRERLHHLSVIDELKSLLKRACETDAREDCWLDHNGGCQAHGFLSEPCPYPLIRQYVTPPEVGEQGSPAAHVKRAATGLADPREASRE